MSITPGKWVWWTSNSFNRLRSEDGHRTRDVLAPVKLRDGQPHIVVTPEDMAVIAAAPAMLAKLEEIRGDCAQCQGKRDDCPDCADIREIIATARKGWRL